MPVLSDTRNGRSASPWVFAISVGLLQAPPWPSETIANMPVAWPSNSFQASHRCRGVASKDGRPVWYVHAALNGRHHAMKKAIQEITAAHDNVRSAVFYEFPNPEDVQGRDYDQPGRITMDWLKRSVPVSDSDFYFCGPKGFMRMLALGLRALGVKEDRIHYEFFGPADELYT